MATKHRVGLLLAAGLALAAVAVLLLIDRVPPAASGPMPAPALPRASLAPGVPDALPGAPPNPRAPDRFGAEPASVAPRTARRGTASEVPPVPPAPAAPAEIPMPPDRAATPEEIEQVRIELDQVGLMLRDYRTRMGENPWGTNAEIMKAVMGANPVQAKLGPPEGQHLNDKGELVDRWGTPLFFHQLSATHMEIHSAGPDRLLGTNDDIIHR